MQCTSIAIAAGMLLALSAMSAGADDSADLIALDKKWGEAGMKANSAEVEKLLADALVSVTGTGVRGKKGEMADLEPAPAGAKYEPTDYKVTFLDADTAIMTHGTKGDEAHYSMHVWSRKGDTWQVVATSSTPVASE